MAINKYGDDDQRWFSIEVCGGRWGLSKVTIPTVASKQEIGVTRC